MKRNESARNKWGQSEWMNQPTNQETKIQRNKGLDDKPHSQFNKTTSNIWSTTCSVQIYPGQIELTLIPWADKSRAIHLLIVVTAALLAWHVQPVWEGCAWWAWTLLMFTTAQFKASAIELKKDNYRKEPDEYRTAWHLEKHHRCLYVVRQQLTKLQWIYQNVTTFEVRIVWNTFWPIFLNKFGHNSAYFSSNHFTYLYLLFYTSRGCISWNDMSRKIQLASNFQWAKKGYSALVVAASFFWKWHF